MTMKMNGRYVSFICELLFCMFLGISGCANTSQMPEENVKSDSREQAVISNDEEAKDITEIYCDIYETAVNGNETGSLPVAKEMVEQLGERGYAAVDSENQIDMARPEQVMQFCEKVNAKEKAELTIIVVSNKGGLTQYEFSTEAGKVDIVRSYYEYENGCLINKSTIPYSPDVWQYTQEGYLIFSGNWFSQESYVLTLSDTQEHVALRVQPLDEKCRELNRKYILPIGYGTNNMFLSDWSEQDYGELDFYDLYDIFYPIVNKRTIPYVADDNLAKGSVYYIPKHDFEEVLMTFFPIDSKQMKAQTTYCPEDAAYEYKPRGYYEAENPEIPYPEVVSYTEKGDGTISLTVNAVYPHDDTSKLFTHEVVVRPLADGGVQYVSNHIISPNGDFDKSWHTDRLTQEEWNQLYGEKSGLCEVTSRAEEECLFTEEEKVQLQDVAMSAANDVKEIYRDFTDKQQKNVVALLGKAGYVSVAEDINMENYEKVETFYRDYLQNQEAEVTIFEVQSDGLIGVITFLYRREKLQTYYVGISWQEGGIPEIKETLVSNLTMIKLTEKGYFIYDYEPIFSHENTTRYYRVKPLSDKCRELTRKYISELSYVNYNLLVIDWDRSNVEDILMPCMFEDIYRIDTGERLQVENNRIPARVYERIMTTYLR